MKTTHIALCALLVVSTVTAAQYTVQGTSDLWLAGAGVATTAEGNDTLSNAAPLGIGSINEGWTYTFSVTGSVGNTRSVSGLTPDGGTYTSHRNGAQNGISDIYAPINSLIGVFLNDATPVAGQQGSTLNFSTIGLNFVSLSPTLSQVFFIGNGVTSSTITQQFIAPSGATRLFLGTMDGYEWNNNSGSFSVTLTAVPEPATYAAFLGVACLVTATIRRYRRKA